MSDYQYRPIAGFLTRNILFWATVSACLMVVMQSVYSYWRVQEEFEEAVREVGESNVPMLSVAIWDIEPVALRRQMQVIASRPQIGYVRLRVSTGQEFSAGDVGLAGLAARKFDIPPPNRPMGVIGQLEIVENPRAFLRELLYSVGPTLFGYGVLTALICALIVFFLKRHLEQPLRGVADFVNHLSPEELTIPLQLDRPVHVHRDEIDLVVEGFSKLQNEISRHIASLDEQVAKRTEELQMALESIQCLSALDPLTGCYNRRLFNERIGQEMERSARYGRPLSLIFCDLDHFKSINDSLGHLVGDKVLQAAAKCLQEGIRGQIDWVARYGGEEFVVVLPETGLAEAVASAERLRAAVPSDVGQVVTTGFMVTASFGVAQYVAGESVQSLLQRADDLLYEAKQYGRNRVFPVVESG